MQPKTLSLLMVGIWAPCFCACQCGVDKQPSVAKESPDTASRPGAALSRRAAIPARGASSPGMASRPNATLGAYTIRNISFKIWRERDGKKYPNQLKESYRLHADGTFDYFGYFGGLPISSNHTDSAKWSSGVHGKRVFKMVRAIIGDRRRFAALKKIPDDGPNPCADRQAYFIGLRHKQADVAYCLPETERRVYPLLDKVFVGLVEEFERKNGRPLTPAKLPGN